MTAPGEPGPRNALIDVRGLRVGHHSAVGDGYLTGTTVVLAPGPGMVAGVDVRGGGPGTRETDLLDPRASVERIHAIVLTGGSAFGLAACTGVTDGLADRGIGLRVGPGAGEVVPIVPGAVLFDLGRGGRFRATPTADFGAAALAAALDGDPDHGAAMGNVGAGTDAVTRTLKGGIGTASMCLPGGVTVGALVAVNAAGSPIDPVTGDLLGARLLHPADGPVPRIAGPRALAALRQRTAGGTGGFRFRGDPDPTTDGEPADDPEVVRNTTLAVVATDAALGKAQCGKVAAVAQNGMARSLNPVHTMFDGDVVFAAATGVAAAPDTEGLHAITVAAADVLTRAIVRALLAARSTATSAGSWPSWADLAGSGQG